MLRADPVWGSHGVAPLLGWDAAQDDPKVRHGVYLPAVRAEHGAFLPGHRGRTDRRSDDDSRKISQVLGSERLISNDTRYNVLYVDLQCT